MRHKKWAAMYATMRVAASVKNENRERRWPMFCMFWCWPGRSEGDTVDASDDDDADWLIYCGRRWCPWLIRESVRPTQWPWPAADMWLPAHAHCDSCQCLCMSSSLSIFSFFCKCTTDLDQAPVTLSWAQAPYPWAPCTLTTLVKWRSTCTYTMMYKGQKQLSWNLFCNYFVSLSPHITFILATGTFLSAGRKSSQTTALYSSVCEYYVQIASPRVCVEFAAFQCRLATRLAPKREQPYSRATVVGSLEITVCDHPCRWSETARKALSLSVWLFSCQ